QSHQATQTLGFHSCAWKKASTRVQSYLRLGRALVGRRPQDSSRSVLRTWVALSCERRCQNTFAASLQVVCKTRSLLPWLRCSKKKTATSIGTEVPMLCITISEPWNPGRVPSQL